MRHVHESLPSVESNPLHRRDKESSGRGAREVIPFLPSSTSNGGGGSKPAELQEAAAAATAAVEPTSMSNPRRRRGIHLGRVFLPYTEDSSLAKRSHSSSTVTVGTAASTVEVSRRSQERRRMRRRASAPDPIDECTTSEGCMESESFVSSITGISSAREIGLMSKDEIIGLLYNEAVRFKEKGEALESKLNLVLQERDQAQVRMMLSNDKFERLKVESKSKIKQLRTEVLRLHGEIDAGQTEQQNLQRALQDHDDEKQVLLFRIEAQDGTIGFLRRKIFELNAIIQNRKEKGSKASTSSGPNVSSPNQENLSKRHSSSSGILSNTSSFANDMRSKIKMRRSKRNIMLTRVNNNGGAGDVQSDISSSKVSSRSSRSKSLTRSKSSNLEMGDSRNPSLMAEDGSGATENNRRRSNRRSSIQNALSFFANEGKSMRMNVDVDDNYSGQEMASESDIISVLSEVKSAISENHSQQQHIPRATLLNTRGPRAA